MIRKTALITGSTSGIGLAIAIAFAKERYNIIFNGLEANGADIASGIADQFLIDHMFSPANMLEPMALREMVAQGTERFGGIDILVNNAGIQHVAPIEDFPEEQWNNIIAINLSAAFHLTKAVWPGMKSKKHGRIINIASAHGLVASENKSAYVAAKHGLVGLTKTTALEGSVYGITCNAICPGFVKTGLVDKQITMQAKTHGITEQEAINNIILAKHAIKEFVQPEAIAAMCLFLVSDVAGSITGTALPIDAGWTAQ